MREIAFAPADHRDRHEILDLLRTQLEEHGVDVTAARLGQAVDGVFDHPEHGFFHVARAGSKVVGVAYVAVMWSLEHFGKSAWLEELYVEPDYRGDGVGTELLLAAMERARRDGYLAVDLEIDAAHAAVERMYEREGFTRLDRSRWVRSLGS